MVVPSLEDCIADGQRETTLQGATGQEWNQIRSAMRGGEGGGAVNLATGKERMGVIPSAKRET